MADTRRRVTTGTRFVIAITVVATGIVQNARQPNKQGVNPREWLIDVIGKMPYYQKPGNNENLKKLLPNYWKNEGN